MRHWNVSAKVSTFSKWSVGMLIFISIGLFVALLTTIGTLLWYVRKLKRQMADGIHLSKFFKKGGRIEILGLVGEDQLLISYPPKSGKKTRINVCGISIFHGNNNVEFLDIVGGIYYFSPASKKRKRNAELWLINVTANTSNGSTITQERMQRLFG